MRRNFRTARAIALAASSAAAGSAAGQTTAVWQGGSGDWDTAGLWSTNPFYPDKDNPLGVTYNALLSTTTGPYTVALNRAITLTDLTIDSPDATLDLTDFVMTVERDFSLSGAARLVGLGGGGTGRISVAGDTTITGSAIQGISRFTATGTVTLSDAALLGVSVFESLGVLRFQGSTTDEICDTGIGHGGTACEWTGTGDILFDGTSFFDHGAASTFTIQGSGSMRWSGLGARPTFTNDGVVVKSSAGVTFVDEVDFTNSATGTLRVDAGTFRANRLTNISSGALSQGIYDITGVLQADGADVTALSTRFTLTGPGAAFVDETGAASGFRNLAAINAGGNLTLRNGNGLAVSGGLALSDDASLTADTGVAISTGPGGDLAMNGAATISLLGPGTSLASGGDIRVLDAASMLVASGAQAVSSGDTLINGSLTVSGSTSLFRVGPGSELLNITAGTISGGNFDLAGGTLQVDNADITTVGSRITLTGPTAKFVDQTGTQSAIRNLAAVANGGDLTLATGQTLATPGSLAINAGGRLAVQEAATQVTTGGDLTVGGSLRVGPGAVVEVAPAFTVTNFADGVFTGGQFSVAGTLRFNPDEPVRKVAGDVTFGAVGAGIVTFGGASVFAPVDEVRPTGRFGIERGFQFSTQGPLRSFGAIAIGQPSGDVDSILTVNGDLDQDAGIVSLGQGRLVVTGTYTIAAGAELAGVGTVQGDIDNHGVISPGVTTGLRGPGGIGTLAILGDVSSTLNGGDPGEVLLRMDVGGTIAGEQYDQLAISGVLNLAEGGPGGIGIVELALAPGYSPVDGDTYRLITFESVMGGFAEYRAPRPGGGVFEFRLDQDALIATYRIPTPGTIGVVAPAAMLGLLARHRRHG